MHTDIETVYFSLHCVTGHSMPHCHNSNNSCYLSFLFHVLSGGAIWLTGRLLWVHIWDFISVPWLWIAHQNHKQWGWAGSLRTDWQPCICGNVMLVSVKVERTRERKWVIKMQIEFRGRKAKTTNTGIVGYNMHTHPSIRAWYRGFCGIWGKIGNPWEKAKEEGKTKMALQNNSQIKYKQGFLKQMDGSRCKWWPTFFEVFYLLKKV